MPISLDLSLVDLAGALRTGTLPLPAYLDALQDQFARREPAVHAFLEEPGRFQRLRREAELLLSRYPDPNSRPYLFGIPVGVKDIFHVDGFVTRAGTSVDSALLQGPEAAVITAVRGAGALILGITVTTEFAYFAPGPTRNPHALAHTPGGSSSGSAAAIAAHLAPLTFGTQTIGSINRPAAFCGVIGFKPSYDRISRDGVIPVSPSADHVGFFVPRADDAAFAAALLLNRWQAVSTERLPILAVPEGPYLEHAGREAREHFTAVIQRLRQAGYQVRHVQAMPDFDDIAHRHQDLVAAEAALVHRDWYAQQGDRYHARTAELIQRGQHVPASELALARESRLVLRQTLGELMRREGIDLWLSPSATGPAPPGLDSTGDPILNLPWTHAGLPALTLPAGRSREGLPLALQLAAGWYADEQLLSWAGPLGAALQPPGSALDK